MTSAPVGEYHRQQTAEMELHASQGTGTLNHHARISVLINTFNEETNLPYALRSVKSWANDIVVVDMHSIDRTVEIAREHGARVFFHKHMGFADPARAFAIAQTTGDWILILDADELIPVALSQRIQEIAQKNIADVVVFPREEYIFGAPMRYTGWGPTQSRHTRFFKRGFLHADAAIHDFLKPIPNARILDLPYMPNAAIIHFAFVDTTQFLDKLNRYSTIEAHQSFARGPRQAPAWVVRDMQSYPALLTAFFRTHTTPWWALVYSFLMFLGRYLKSKGYRDGRRGFYLSLFNAFYFLACYAKLSELEACGTFETIEETYRQRAEHILEEYKAERET